MFIALEGIDGTGKSTLAVALTRQLNDHGIAVANTRSPGGTGTGLLFRELLLGSESPVELTPLAGLLTFLADRAEHVPAIRTALLGGELVLCDRFSASTLAYQQAQGFPLEMLRALNDMVCQGLRPDLTLYLDASPFELEMRRGKDDRFEREKMDFHCKVRANYLALRDDSWVTLDAMGLPEVVAEQAYQAVRARL